MRLVERLPSGSLGLAGEGRGRGPDGSQPPEDLPEALRDKAAMSIQGSLDPSPGLLQITGPSWTSSTLRRGLGKTRDRKSVV